MPVRASTRWARARAKVLRGHVGARLVIVVALGLAGAVADSAPSSARPVRPISCRWERFAPLAVRHPAATAAAVVARMTLQQKVAFLGLQPIPLLRIEEENPGVPSLCVPPLVLRDGPAGVAAGAQGITAFPSPLNLASTFDPSLAVRYGTDIGREARAQGTMGLQGPELNVSIYDNWGRSWENLGEDPTLTSVLGTSLVTGIQRTGAFAMAKHMGPYVQETGRSTVNDIVTARAAKEVYLAPFRAAVRAGVASIMCADGRMNGVESCSDAATISETHTEGFAGLIRTDAGASSDEVRALKSGVDLFRPFDPAPVEAALANGTLPVSVVDRAVRDVLTVMLRYDDVTNPIAADAARPVTTPGAVALSRTVAERSMVLLKNSGVLPLAAGQTGTIAVIGAAAAQAPIVTGGGSSHVLDTQPTTDLMGIDTLVPRQRVTYTPATSPGVPLLAGPASPDPTVPGYQEAPLVLPPTTSGLVDFAYATRTPTRLSVDGSVLLQNVQLSSGLPITFERAVELAPGTHDVQLIWPTGVAAPTVTAQSVDGLIAQAAAAAQAARVAIVDVGEFDSEGVDRASLALPGYQDQLIEAVAAANPRTIVVVHSGGPVLMPWLGSVAAVVEAWYPGQVAGTALAAVLSGAVDPSGRLPVSFPTTDAAAPLIPSSAWPTPVATANLTSLGDLAVGSRWYAAHGIAPLFPFGFGLSYTTFSQGAISAQRVGGAIVVRVPVANTGPRDGRYVALADVTDPPGSGEPPHELRAFGVLPLLAHRAGTIALTIPVPSLEVYEGRWRLIPGTYTVTVGARSVAVTIG